MGDGGWGIIVQAHAFSRLAGRLSGYLFGAYQLNPRNVTEVTFTPTSVSPLSVPDVYHARFGLALAVLPKQGLSASLGLRADVHSSPRPIGSSDGFRASARSVFIDPGLSWSIGQNDFTLSVPVRVHGEFFRGEPLPEFQSNQGDRRQEADLPGLHQATMTQGGATYLY